MQAVTNRKYWGQIIAEVIPQSPQMTINIIKTTYRLFLYDYEIKDYFSLDPQQPLPVFAIVKKNPTFQIKKTQDGDLLNQIYKTVQEQDRATAQFYLNKSKLCTNKVQSKKILLGLQPYMSKNDLVYSLNMLLLYSVNSTFPFLFEMHEQIFDAISQFSHSISPPADDESLQYLRTVTLIFRNLTMNPINLKYMLGTPIFQLLVNIFNSHLDYECSKNIVDIMSGLVKVGWDCDRIFLQINDALLEGREEEVDLAIEMLKGLVDQREEALATAVISHIKILIRVLLCSEVHFEVKELTLEILAFVTDVSVVSREQFLKNTTLLSILINILKYMRNQQKMCQFAALTLSNIATAEEAKTFLKHYEQELVAIAFSGDSLAGIIAHILADISTV